jgi:glycosyltransferase involved in cell wall biosynthesis
MSVIKHVDKVLIWDTGSTDNTVKIIQEIKRRHPNKIIFNEVGDIDIDEFTKARQEMLNETDADWFLVVDGDEIWWDESIRKVVDLIKKSGDRIESIVVPTYNLVGDMYHYQEKAAGRYKLAGKFGHYNLRAINRNIPGLKSAKPHGTWGWTDENDKMIQDRSVKKVKFVDAPYIHATFLQRSVNLELDKNVPKRARKLKCELGDSSPSDFYYPEVFFKPRPTFVLSPWRKMDKGYFAKAMIQTPLRKVKRRLIHGKVGY